MFWIYILLKKGKPFDVEEGKEKALNVKVLVLLPLERIKNKEEKRTNK